MSRVTMLASVIDALPGWRSVSDLQTAIGVVPLVAVGPAGAYAIATVPAPHVRTLADVPERWLIDAWAQAKHLERRRVGGDVTAMLVLEGATEAPSGRRRGVQVLSDSALGAWLAARPARLSPGEANLLRNRLDDAPLTLVLAA
jgi:hypothetical protein